MPGRTRRDSETDRANVATPGRAREVSGQQVRAFSHHGQHGGFVAELVAHILSSEITTRRDQCLDCVSDVLTSVIPLPIGLDDEFRA